MNMEDNYVCEDCGETFLEPVENWMTVSEEIQNEQVKIIIQEKEEVSPCCLGEYTL